MDSQEQSRTAHGRATLQRSLLDHHARIRELLLRVAACVVANDPHGALAEWPTFERALLEHMQAEELYILPAFGEIDEVEAKALRDEHAQFRAELGDLGLALELHTARKWTFDALVTRLMRHAAREDELVYLWADRNLAERLRDAVLHRLRAR